MDGGDKVWKKKEKNGKMLRYLNVKGTLIGWLMMKNGAFGGLVVEMLMAYGPVSCSRCSIADAL